MGSTSSLVGAGREAEILAWGEGRVLRLIRDPDKGTSLDREAAALRAAASAGAPVPQVYDRIIVEERLGLVMDRLDGIDLLRRVERRPWAVRRVGWALGRLHARLHRIAAPSELPRYREEVAKMLNSSLVDEEVGDDARQRLFALADGDRLCHGDFHPGNVLGGRVIDWTDAAAGDPATDVARSCLLLAAAATPGERAVWRRPGEGIARLHLVDAYLRGYRSERPLDADVVERWLPVLAAARLSEGVETEREPMLRIARSHGVLRLPSRIALDASQRRWIWVNAVLITAVLNLLANGALAWASAAGREQIPLWSTPLVGGPSTVTDTVGTLFLLPLITCVLVTTAVRRDLARGRVGRRVDLVYLLPRNRFVRGFILGAGSVAALAPPAILLLVVLDFGDITPDTFMAYKAVLGVAFGALATPFIALAAMND